MAATVKPQNPPPRAQELGGFSLGSGQTHYPEAYAPEVLEAFANRHPEVDAWTSFLCPEFTALCPKTRAPDFAHITINYMADGQMVESKSLKLYLASFRNHGIFHEDVVQTLCRDLSSLLSPRYIEVIGEFTPRGGLHLYPFASADNGKEAYRKIRRERMASYWPRKYSARP